jgi:trk system potassium uptake protein
MNIIIAGDGEVGFHLAKMLSHENHNITIVDPHRELLKMIESQSDLMAIAGDSTSISILKGANVHKADLLISVLHDEQTNLLTAILAKKLGAKRVIARVNNPEFLTPENKLMIKDTGIDHIISPESIAAKEIVSLLNQSATNEIFHFSDGKLSLLQIKLDNKAKVLNRSLRQISSEFTNLDFRAVAIHRRGKTIIPSGDELILEHDLAYVITKPEGVDQLMELGGKTKISINNVMIIGGGRIGRMTALSLQDKLNIKLIEQDKDRCLGLADILDRTLIINGDARSIELLEEEDIRSMDAFIALTRDSETNIITCLLAQRFGVKRTIALVENIEYIDIAQNMGIDTIINKKLITASYIVRFTMDAWVTSIKCLSGIDAEVLEFVVREDSFVTRKPIRKLRIPEGAIIGGVVRGEKSFITDAEFQIEAHDKVVVFSLPGAIQKVDKIFNS